MPIVVTNCCCGGMHRIEIDECRMAKRQRSRKRVTKEASVLAARRSGGSGHRVVKSARRMSRLLQEMLLQLQLLLRMLLQLAGLQSKQHRAGRGEGYARGTEWGRCEPIHERRRKEEKYHGRGKTRYLKWWIRSQSMASHQMWHSGTRTCESC